MPALQANVNEIKLVPSIPTAVVITTPSRTMSINNVLPLIPEELQSQLSNVQTLNCYEILPIGQCSSQINSYCTMIFTAKPDAVEIRPQTVVIQGSNTHDLSLTVSINTKFQKKELISR